MLENTFKTGLVKELKARFPGCIVLHADPNEIQGIPDLLVLYEDRWAALEGKKSAKASHRPNQDYYVEKMNNMSYFGICDLAGFPKDIYYMYQSRWTTKPMVHILPMDWDSWTVGAAVPVWLYSNCPSMELFQDGVSLGKKTQADAGDKYQFAYSVTYAKGTLTAKGYDANGAVVATDEVKTSTGTPAKLVLSSYKPTVDVTTDDLVFITCDIQDVNGVFVPRADTKVTFTCEGGSVLGTDNGNAACVEPMRTNVKTAFNGKVLCVCRHDGKAGTLTVTATADGLTAGSVSVEKMGG